MDRMRRSSRFTVAVAGALAACGVLAATASAGPVPQTSPPDPLDPRTTAPESRLFLVTHAIGFQTYQCNGTGTAWTFTGPVATLYKTTGTSKPIGTHFRNPVTTRPVWQLKDGSSVEAAAIVTMPAAAGNIPLLLLQAVAWTEGSDGDRLTPTTYIQRLNTSGGLAPAVPCTPNAAVRVPYEADYFFWRAGGGD
jgi:Protein of unknown function (DUF3455)